MIRIILGTSNQFQFNKLLTMNILPKSYSQFRDKTYWNTFFSTLKGSKEQYFEWYGTFNDLKVPLMQTFNHLYNLNGKNKIMKCINIGCGKSTLGQDIVNNFKMFDLAMMNVDYSEQIISQMSSRNNDKIKYEVLDLLQPIPQKQQGKYNLVIDKGTLDAILPQLKEEIVEEIKNKYFINVQSLLNNNVVGAYIIVTMAQQFILETVIEYFFDGKHKIKIYQILLADTQMQPFMIDIRHHKQGIKDSKEVDIIMADRTVHTFVDKNEVIKKIEQIQKLNLYSKNIKKLIKGQSYEFNIFNKDKRIKYMIDILDSSNQTILQTNTCAVFIIPQGHEGLPFYSNDKGRRQVMQQVGTSRLIFVKLVIGNVFGSLQQIKLELNPVLPNLVQKNCKVNEVPYLTDGSIGNRNYLFEDQNIYVEQILFQNEAFRRLILKSNLSVVQTQFKLTYISAKNKQLIESNIFPKKKNLNIGIEENYLDDGYCRVITTGLNKLISKPLEQSSLLHLGSGGGALAKYLKYKNGSIRQILVQKQKSILKIGQKCFQWPQKDNHFNIICDDALHFIEKYEQKDTFDGIIIDINGNESKNEQFPPIQFLSDQFINNCVQRLSEGGILVYNCLVKSDKVKDQQRIKKIYQNKFITLVYHYRKNQIDNHVIFAVKKSISAQGDTKIWKTTKTLKDNKECQWEELSDEIQLVLPTFGTLIKGSQVILEQSQKVVEDKKKKKKKK